MDKKKRNSPHPALRTTRKPQTTVHIGRTPTEPLEESGPSPDDRRWKSCCLSMDRTAARFFSLLMLTVFILTFVFYQLANTDPCDSAPLWGLIGTLIGFWFDGPSLKSKK